MRSLEPPHASQSCLEGTQLVPIAASMGTHFTLQKWPLHGHSELFFFNVIKYPAAEFLPSLGFLPKPLCTSKTISTQASEWTQEFLAANLPSCRTSATSFSPSTARTSSLVFGWGDLLCNSCGNPIHQRQK